MLGGELMKTPAILREGGKVKQKQRQSRSDLLMEKSEMDAATFGSSQSDTSSNKNKFDVFLSFRGEDTRKIFAGYLHKALKQKGIDTFIDSNQLRKRNGLPELVQVIQDSKASVVLFSENYASSTWCLNELVTIMDCMDRKKQIVVPVFYQVDPSDLCDKVNPSDVPKLKRKFAEAFAAHEKNCSIDREKLESWKSALSRVANLSGWDAEYYEDDAKLIENIVQDILSRLMHISSTESRGLVGMDTHVQNMKALLQATGRDNDIHAVGIVGIAGLGKTTIARAVYDEISHQFDHSCFLDNEKEGFIKDDLLQEMLLSSILTETGFSLPASDGGSNSQIKMPRLKLGRKKVLLVLDDVDDVAQIENLLKKKHSYGEGSRIIITTRNSQLLSRVGNIYNPTPLSCDEALKLFSQYAFRENHPPDDYFRLSKIAISYAQGLPLALKVLGASLNNKSVCEWDDALKKVTTIPQLRILSVLKTSYEGLDDYQKNIFLDIACFFKGMDKDNAIEILDDSTIFPHSGLRVLVDRALVSISTHNRLHMHDLLQELGREIVRQESAQYPGKRSRLWRSEDVIRVLTKNTATEAVESMVLDLSRSKQVHFNTEAFAGMTRLRLLKIGSLNLSTDFDNYKNLSCDSWDPRDDGKQQTLGDLKFLSELRCLIWDGFPLKSLPSSFSPKNLVYISMRYSRLEQLWEGTKPFKKLKFINLDHCRCLRRTPDFTGLANLERLNLEFCSSLVEVHPSMSVLQDLSFLSLKGCEELEALPSSIHLTSLKTLDLSGCSHLKKFPEIRGVMKELSKLYLDKTAIEQLPSSIERLQGLQLLSMRDCKRLIHLPDNICNLGCLTDLALTGCSRLSRLPGNLGSLDSLRKLEVGQSGIRELTFAPLHLENLVRRCRETKLPLASLFSPVGNKCTYSSLLHLDLSDCNLSELSSDIGHLSSLKTLDLRRSNLESLPATVNQLCNLTHLELESCKRLKSIPELPSSINFVDAHNCIALEIVSTPKPQYSMNLCFTFSNCLGLGQTNLFRDIVKTLSHYQGNHLRGLSFEMSLPGSEIPEWFGHQCRGSSVTVQLLPRLFDGKLLGFAICAVIDFKGDHNYTSDLSAKCVCTFKGNRSEHTFSFNMLVWSFKSKRYLQSDHMFLGYAPWSKYCCSENREPINEYYSEASFRIVVENGLDRPDFDAPAHFHSIKSCGVQLFYANNVVEELSFTQTKYHSDNYGMTHEDSGKATIEELSDSSSREVSCYSDGGEISYEM